MHIGKKIKICIIGDAGHINLMNWCNYIVKDGNIDLNIVTFRNPINNEKKIKTFKIGESERFFKFRYVFYITKLRKILRHLKPHLVIGYRINSYGFMAVMSGYNPIVNIAQGTDIFFNNNYYINRNVLKFVIKNTKLVHVWSEHMAEELKKYGAKEESLFIMPKGIDLTIFKPNEIEKLENTLTIITTRQLRKTYNHELLLYSLIKIKKANINFQLLICGDGEYRAELEYLTKRLEISENVLFLGHMKYEKLPSLLNKADIYISTQENDGVSSSLLEAMACGVFPIVINNNANKRWIKNNINGYLVEKGNKEMLANAILNAYRFAEKRSKAKLLNIDIVKREANIEKNIGKTIEKYMSIMSQKR